MMMMMTRMMMKATTRRIIIKLLPVTGANVTEPKRLETEAVLLLLLLWPFSISIKY